LTFFHKVITFNPWLSERHEINDFFYKTYLLLIHMKTSRIILGIILTLILILVTIYAYYGGFYKINFEVRQGGGETLVYRSLKGDYSQTGKVTDEIYQILLSEYEIETFNGFGIYYDNPAEVATEELRSDVGCILPDAHADKIPMLESEFKVETAPFGDFVVAEFPYRGQLSFMVGVMKVYPAMARYVEQQGLNPNTPVMEIYDIPNKKIIYRKEIVEL